MEDFVTIFSSDSESSDDDHSTIIEDDTSSTPSEDSKEDFFYDDHGYHQHDDHGYHHQHDDEYYHQYDDWADDVLTSNRRRQTRNLQARVDQHRHKINHLRHTLKTAPRWRVKLEGWEHRPKPFTDPNTPESKFETFRDKILKQECQEHLSWNATVVHRPEMDQWLKDYILKQSDMAVVYKDLPHDMDCRAPVSRTFHGEFSISRSQHGKVAICCLVETYLAIPICYIDFKKTHHLSSRLFRMRKKMFRADTKRTHHKYIDTQ